MLLQAERIGLFFFLFFLILFFPFPFSFFFPFNYIPSSPNISCPRHSYYSACTGRSFCIYGTCLVNMVCTTIMRSPIVSLVSYLYTYITVCWCTRKEIYVRVYVYVCIDIYIYVISRNDCAVILCVTYRESKIVSFTRTVIIC